MNLQERIEILQKLKDFLLENNEEWKAVKQRAFLKNSWFTLQFIDTAINNICQGFLQKKDLEGWVNYYCLDDNIASKNVGIVMPGNIPLVGFHDFLSVFISSHKQTIKLSEKDSILLPYIVQKMMAWDTTGYIKNQIAFADLLKGCDAYIATGSNNSARYFHQYFSKYPHIIRHNRTSVAILNGSESEAELKKLSDDVHLYFGLGCRSVSKIFVPKGYDFLPMINAFKAYNYFGDHHKYRNNYDYQLSLALLNNIYYMTSGSTLLIENEAFFSPISQLNYTFYDDRETLEKSLEKSTDTQCIVGEKTAFGIAQQPKLFDYADGEDAIAFLLTL